LVFWAGGGAVNLHLVIGDKAGKLQAASRQPSGNQKRRTRKLPGNFRETFCRFVLKSLRPPIRRPRRRIVIILIIVPMSMRLQRVWGRRV